MLKVLYNVSRTNPLQTLSLFPPTREVCLQRTSDLLDMSRHSSRHTCWITEIMDRPGDQSAMIRRTILSLIYHSFAIE